MLEQKHLDRTHLLQAVVQMFLYENLPVHDNGYGQLSDDEVELEEKQHMEYVLLVDEIYTLLVMRMLQLYLEILVSHLFLLLGRMFLLE